MYLAELAARLDPIHVLREIYKGRRNMKHERKLLNLCKSMVVGVLVLGVSILNIHIPYSAAAEKKMTGEAVIASESTSADTITQVPAGPEKDDMSAQDAAAQYQAAVITQKAESPEPQTTTTDSSGHTLLYVGVGAAAIAAVAVAAGGGGGGSSSEAVEAEPEPKLAPVGADLNGDNWHGRLILKDSGFKEDVTATVEQNGSRLIITTSSAQKYGKKFIGSIDKSAFIKVRDQDTGQDWTTHYTHARWNMIDLYDYVHNFHDLDRLYLERDAKQ